MRSSRRRSCGSSPSAAATRSKRRSAAIIAVARRSSTCRRSTAASRRSPRGARTSARSPPRIPSGSCTLETGTPGQGRPRAHAPRDRSDRADRLRPARTDRRAGPRRQDDAAAGDHRRRRDQPSRRPSLLVLLVDERPEEVSEMISWGVGEVVASSFDSRPTRHVDVAEMVLERARRLVEMGKDVVIVLDSITRMARAHNTVERGTGRTLVRRTRRHRDGASRRRSSARRASVAPQHGGGSLTIIATALVETGSRMDDVIFEEFKGTGNCEIKLDRSLAEKRIYPGDRHRDERHAARGQAVPARPARRRLHPAPRAAADAAAVGDGVADQAHRGDAEQRRAARRAVRKRRYPVVRCPVSGSWRRWTADSPGGRGVPGSISTPEPDTASTRHSPCESLRHGARPSSLEGVDSVSPRPPSSRWRSAPKRHAQICVSRLRSTGWPPRASMR